MILTMRFTNINQYKLKTEMRLISLSMLLRKKPATQPKEAQETEEAQDEQI